LRGVARAPGDKSIGHRSIMFGALASGPVRITGLGGGADNRGTARAFAQLGVSMRSDGDALRVEGAGVHGLRAPGDVIDCGNSGTTIRLMCGLLAGQRFDTVLTGDESLRQRPMRRVTEPLAQMGARIDGDTAPLTIHAAAGPLRGIDYAMPIASGQVKSAVLLAALYAEGETRVIEPGPTRDHTERMLRYLGAPVRSEGGGVARFDPAEWNGELAARPIEVPGDPSSAAFLIAAAVLAGADDVRVENVCLNPTRTGFLDALAAMGAVVHIESRRDGGPEPTGDLRVAGSDRAALRATTIDGNLVVRSIDEIPILAVVAAMAEGTTWFRNVAELRVKESDRIATTAAMLRAFGVTVDEQPDAFAVHGRAGQPFTPARVDAAGDHRIAMSATVAALAATADSRIDDVTNVATSYPAFLEALTGLRSPH
jgi:3-phosphoshikimate 1-carboxyvinyltransferase